MQDSYKEPGYQIWLGWVMVEMTALPMDGCHRVDDCAQFTLDTLELIKQSYTNVL